MSIDLPSIDISALAFEVAERSDTNAWTTVVVSDGSPHDIVDSLRAALRQIADLDCAIFEEPSVDRLATELHRAKEPVAIVAGLDRLVPSDWVRLDGARPRLARAGAVVLMLSAPAAEQLIRFAPNLLSWLGTIRALTPSAAPLSPAESEPRLASLRAHFGFSDEELLARADRHDLPADPEIAEWLVLLGRGELLER